MALLGKFLLHAVKRVAINERVQRAAADTYKNEIKPRAQAAWDKARPRIEETKADIGHIAEETDARRHPARFAGKVTRRVLNELKPKPEKD